MNDRTAAVRDRLATNPDRTPRQSALLAQITTDAAVDARVDAINRAAHDAAEKAGA